MRFLGSTYRKCCQVPFYGGRLPLAKSYSVTNSQILCYKFCTFSAKFVAKTSTMDFIAIRTKVVINQ